LPPRPLIRSRFTVNAEAAKSVTQRGAFNIDGDPNNDNDAFKFKVGYNGHKLEAGLGYLYIDPRFSAPGYWLKLGNWYNPTNVQGPFVHAGYEFSPKLNVYVDGNYLCGARNRYNNGGAADSGNATGVFNGLGLNDKVYAVKFGVGYKINKTFSVTGDYEGDFWDLSSTSSATGAENFPLEQYITIGAGVNLAGNTTLKFAYQIITASDYAGFTGGTTNSNASVFTTQVAVHF
jgi:hypothetical protein